MTFFDMGRGRAKKERDELQHIRDLSASLPTVEELEKFITDSIFSVPDDVNGGLTTEQLHEFVRDMRIPNFSVATKQSAVPTRRGTDPQQGATHLRLPAAINNPTQDT